MVRLFIMFLAIGIGVTQYQLWCGRASWFRLDELQESLEAQRAENEALRAQNEALQAELYSLRHNSEAIEARARMDLNMVRPSEILFRIEPLERAVGNAETAEADIKAIETPDIAAGSKPTFEPKKSGLYRAPKNQRAPKARDRRE